MLKLTEKPVQLEVLRVKNSYEDVRSNNTSKLLKRWL